MEKFYHLRFGIITIILFLSTSIVKSQTYCTATGDGSYNASKVVTTGGVLNIDFTADSGLNNYVLSSGRAASEQGGTFNLSVTNSNGWSRTIVWIDWNGDLDFEDAGEQLVPLSSENLYSGEDAITYSTDITVPADAFIGTVRMRILTGDAWTYNDEGIPASPCGELSDASIKDFRLEILSSGTSAQEYCIATGADDYYGSTIITSGGSTNINLISEAGTDNYMFSTEKLTIAQSETFNLSVENSNGWSRTIVWVDWNGDLDFEDEGEQLPPFSEEELYSGDDPITYSIDVTVPPNTAVGQVRMRILTGDAWIYNDAGIPNSPCGPLPSSAIKDFDIDILVGEFSGELDCSVIKGSGDYNANNVTTTGGTTNINFTSDAGVDNYVLSTQKVSVLQEGTFNLSVENSNGWSRTIVWVDWNGDLDFEDEGEQLPPLSEEELYSGADAIAYSIDVNVPADAFIGTVRMRILTGDAWIYNDAGIPSQPCGELDNASFKDFNVEIGMSLGAGDLNQNMSFGVYPNPSNDFMNIDIYEINNKNVKVFIYNTLGEVVMDLQFETFNSPERVPISNSLSNGVYFVKVISDNKIYNSKLIKK